MTELNLIFLCALNFIGGFMTYTAIKIISNKISIYRHHRAYIKLLEEIENRE